MSLSIFLKAHQLDEADLSTTPCLSSALDDTFYILKKVLSRLISTSSASTIVSASVNIITILERDFADVLKKRMEAAHSAGGQQQQVKKEDRDREARMASIVSLYPPRVRKRF
jgi:hypothetical protein